MELPAASLRPRERYELMTSIIVPRPIAWITTQTEDGHTNLAPFSYFNGLSSEPPLITVAIADRKDGPKDTLRLARATGVFCVNFVEDHDLDRMNDSSADHPAEVSEVTLLGIATSSCVAIRCARVASARAHLECRLVDVHRYGTTNLMVAEVVHFAVADALLEEQAPSPRASPWRARPVARLGGPWYATLGVRQQRRRPSVR